MKRFVLAAALLITAAAARAQITDISEDVIGKSLLNVRKDVQKVSDQPQTKDTVIPAPAFNYKIVSKQIPVDFRIDTIRPAKLSNEPLNKLYHGYAKVGFGNYSTILADASYASTRSKSGSWGIRARSLSSGTGPKDVQGFAGYSQQNVDLFGRKFLKHHTVSGNLLYDRDVVHYYGNVSGYDSLSRESIKQRFQLFGGGGRLVSHYTDSAQINYDVQMRYYNFADRFGSNENSFVIDGTGGRYLNTEKLTADFAIDYNRGKSIDDTINSTIIKLQPMFRAGGGDKKFAVAVGLGMYIDDRAGDTRYYFYPQAEFCLNVADHIIEPYAGITGRQQRNSFRSLAAQNPFILSALSVYQQNTQHRNEIYAGLKGSISSEISYNIKAMHVERRNLPLFVHTMPYQDLYQLKFDVVYDSVDVTGVSGDIGYQQGEKLRITAHGEFMEYKTKNQAKAWHMPALRMGVSANYNLRDKILARADIFYIDRQYARLVNSQGQTEQILLNNLVDVNIGLEYRYSKFLSAYASFQNLAGQRYFRFQNYPTQKFNALLGITYSF